MRASHDVSSTFQPLDERCYPSGGQLEQDPEACGGELALTRHVDDRKHLAVGHTQLMGEGGAVPRKREIATVEKLAYQLTVYSL